MTNEDILKNHFGCDPNYVSKREAFNSIVKLVNRVNYLTIELFKQNSGHEIFRDLSKEQFAELMRIKLSGRE